MTSTNRVAAVGVGYQLRGGEGSRRQDSAVGQRRPDLAVDPRFDSDERRAADAGECIAELDVVFATKSLAEWRLILSTQDDHGMSFKRPVSWPATNRLSPTSFIQDVDYGDGRIIKMVSVPVQFGREALKIRPAPELGANNDDVLAESGFDDDQIIDLKVVGVVY